MNVFQLSYIERLRSWRNLRDGLRDQTSENRAVMVDRWWQFAPIIKHHLHWNDTENWTNPWEILSENTYCPLTRAVGMCYTLLLLNMDTELLYVTDQQSEEHYLVSVDGAKYLLNYWPNSVLNISLKEFNVRSTIQQHVLKQKLQ